MRTACQVISKLDLESINSNLFGLSPLVIQERHDQAFDVEPVTQEFFRQYHTTFTQVEDLIRGIVDKDRKRLFTQRLFNRPRFIAFIQKKGWLQFGGKKNQDYLNALWADYRKNGSREMGFYYERLYTLFFHGLGAQLDYDLMSHRRLIVTPIGVDIKRYPAVFGHLRQWKSELEKRCDRGDHWWELRPCDYYSEFDKPRILFPDIAKESRFAYGEPGLYTVNMTYFICSENLFLLGVLNSAPVWTYCKRHLTVLGDAEKGGRLRFFRQFVELIPIPRASPQEEPRIASLVKKRLEKKGEGCTKWEDEINHHVANLCGMVEGDFK